MSSDTHQWFDEHGPGPDPAGVCELLVVRPGGLASTVRAVPALRHLRETYPVARISVAAETASGELLETCPFVDRMIALERPSEALLEAFDVAISFADPSSPATLSLDDVHARFRAAWGERQAGERSVLHPLWPARLDESTRMLRLAWLLGGSLDADPRMGLWPSLADRNGAARLVADSNAPIAVVHIGASSADREWIESGWSPLIDMLDELGLDVVVVGTGEDRSASTTSLSGTRHAPLSVVGRASIGELVALLERAVLFVGTDSGPAALAGAVGVRSVIIGPGSRLEHRARPGVIDLVEAGTCERCGDLACEHAPPPASMVPIERALARVELAALTALEQWRRAQIA